MLQISHGELSAIREPKSSGTHRMLAGFLCTTAIQSAFVFAALHPLSTRAQEIIPRSNVAPIVRDSTGISPAPQIGNDQPGAAGGSGSDFDVELAVGQALRSATTQLVDLSSAGGTGGDAGPSYGSSNARGGNGGSGGDLTFTIDGPSDDQATSLITEGLGIDTVALTSGGGAGGLGGQAASNVSGAIGGQGGNGGNLAVAIPAPTDATSNLTTIIATQTGFKLLTQGGAGGTSGDSSDYRGVDGGAAGSGGTIDLTATAGIAAYRFSDGNAVASGIVAMSIGGDGGDGGGTTSAHGSNGGTAGQGGRITLNLEGASISAQGTDAAASGNQDNFDSSITPGTTVPLATSILAGAVIAISQGGEGGMAGTINGFVTNGGNGAAGGDGGAVTVNVATYDGAADEIATIQTSGYGAVGVLAMSAGADGGDGDSGGGAFFRKGGAGGTGGNGQAATIAVYNYDTTSPYSEILTNGDDSDALVAISLGGGGGYSGDLKDTQGGGAFNVYIGGEGGNGGDGGVASISNGYATSFDTSGAPMGLLITTRGTFSRGMVVQSVGGGGGRGGDALSTSLGAAVTIGGKGGAGGNGGAAHATNYGLINTTGSHSTGMFAQSVGGGGGSGGGALSRVVSGQITIGIAVGGDGGKGGDAGSVDIWNLGQSQTSGANAHAMFAQSVGGGGGVGGTAAAETYNTSAPDFPSITVTTAVGGRGGVAGTGGYVFAMNSGLLQTQGQDAYGIFAQSVGGGGGSGGDATATSTAYQQSKLNVTTAIGGSGGGGGDGGAVEVHNSGLVTTDSATSIGIFAQSIGGGGGNGGFASTNQGAVYQAGAYTAEVSVAVGGQGGVAGDGGDVAVYNYISSDPSDPGYLSNSGVAGNGAVLTQGEMAPAIFAQSIGGGGGNGGDATGKGANGQLNMNVAIGGGGGAGGDGGSVLIHNGPGTITTYGAQSYGIFGQSVGGGGGTGGNASTGGGTDPEYGFPQQAIHLAASSLVKDPVGFTPVADCGTVTDCLWDWKDNVKGAWDDVNRLKELAGLNSGINTGPAPKFGGLTGADLTIDVGGGAGGNGGAAGNGGNVTIDTQSTTFLNGSIVTNGSMAYGIFGQSVGGGGGVGGGSAPATSNDQLHNSAIELAVAVGGQGGKGGDGGIVTITASSFLIETFGDMSFGLFGQSIGGGGGVGGATLPNAGLGNLMALSIGSNGLDAEHVVSGKGGLVTVNQTSNILTYGNHAIGLVAQSIGGGGGFIGVSGQTIDAVSGLGVTNTQALAGANIKPALAANYLSTNNTGGAVNVNLTGGAIQTSGVNAFGVLAQSIGGGGGLIVVDPNNQVTVDEFAPNIDNSAPSGKHNAGIVSITAAADAVISTTGNGAVGIVAQSIGGGGGIVNGFDGVDMTAAPHGLNDRWDLGMGGAIKIDNSSNITTTGQYAHGIYAQIASGTGGVIGRSDGTGVRFRSIYPKGAGIQCGDDHGGESLLMKGGTCGGEVQVILSAGTIAVSGAMSWGVVLESEDVAWHADGYGDQISGSSTWVSLQDGAIVLANGLSSGAILLNGTAFSTVDNSGTIDATRWAVATVENTEYTVFNRATGHISGNFGSNCNTSQTCQSVSAVSTIQNAGTIEAGEIVDLGGGILTNSGALYIGRANAIGKTVLTGDLIQDAAGVLHIDADMKSGTADRLDITGKATIAGTVHVAPATVSNRTLTVLTAAGGVVLDPALKQEDSSAMFSFPLKTVGNGLQLTAKAHFSEVASGLSNGRRAVADNLQALFDGGATMDDGFTALSQVGDSAGVASSLDALGGQALGAIGAFRYASSRAFVGNLNDGCQTLQGVGNGTTCSWAKVQAMAATQDATANELGYNADAQLYQMGVQTELREGLYLNAAAAYEHGIFKDAGGTARVTGDILLIGAGLRYHSGPWEFAGAVDGGYGAYKSHRVINVGSSSAIARAEPKSWQLGLHLRSAYTLDLGRSVYLRPFANLHAMHVHASGFEETGASPFNLDVVEQGEWAVTGGAGVELGTSIELRSGLTLHPFASAAFELNGSANWTTSARFAGQTQGDRFAVTTAAPSHIGKFAIGLDLLGSERVDMSVSYSPEIGEDYRSNTATARLTYRF